MTEIKDVIKNRRTELRLTIDELASKVGVSGATVSRWESGARSCPSWTERLVIEELKRIKNTPPR